MVDSIAAAIGRMTPDSRDIESVANYLARKETDCACRGYVLATYLADVIEGLADLHADECRNHFCRTCAGIATAATGIAAHRRLHDIETREENTP